MNRKFLVFIDTCKLLDFYSPTEMLLSFLKHIDSISTNLIMTFQVEMEFKKNRQEIIWQAIKSLSIDKPSLPGIIRESSAGKDLTKSMEATRRLVKQLKGDLEKILGKPEEDIVFKQCEKYFRADSPTNLKVDHAHKDDVIRLSQERFLRGCPPRKTKDTSFGDAINWEWIVKCATEFKKDIIIVTRDGDYGLHVRDKSVLNDWLASEFEKRVGRDQKIVLTNLLGKALQLMGISVSADAAEEEKEAVKLQTERQEPGFWSTFFVPGSSSSLTATTATTVISPYYPYYVGPVTGSIYPPSGGFGAGDAAVRDT